MGFGFNLFFIFILIPITGLLFVAWIYLHKSIFGKVLGFLWGGVVLLVLLSLLVRPLYEKKVLEKKDYYGQYVIDRSFFSGKQADWQYNTFRFEIKENDTIILYVSDDKGVVKSYTGTITTVKPYASERLSIYRMLPLHHIFTTDPTVYRRSKDFYLVFNSPKFGNMFFVKGEW